MCKHARGQHQVIAAGCRCRVDVGYKHVFCVRARVCVCVRRVLHAKRNFCNSSVHPLAYHRGPKCACMIKFNFTFSERTATATKHESHPSNAAAPPFPQAAVETYTFAFAKHISFYSSLLALQVSWRTPFARKRIMMSTPLSLMVWELTTCSSNVL